MKNLACNHPTYAQILETNATVGSELREAGIPIVQQDPTHRGEVPSEYKGQYEGFTFTRAWYYWVVTGAVSMEAAKEIYANPIGVTDVRAEGHCACPPPEDQSILIDDNTKRIVVANKEWKEGIDMYVRMKSERSLMSWMTEYISDKDVKSSTPYVRLYHIDSQEGLNLFMQTIRKYNLTGKV